VIRWILAASPLIALLLALLTFKLGARKSGMLAWVMAVFVAAFVFGAGIDVLSYASLKGAALTLYIVTIIWTSAFMFSLISETGLFPLVSKSMMRLIDDRLWLGMLIAWCCSGVIQGIAGYGVPVAVCAPLMIAVGFPPLQAVAAVLVGHAWSVTFGSMGASYHALTMSTELSADAVGYAAGLAFVLPTIVTGLLVAHLLGGWDALRSRWPKIAIIGASMSGVQWFAASNGMGHLAALLGATSGVLAITLIGRSRHKAVGAQSVKRQSTDRRGLFLVMSPYYALLFMAILGQVIGPWVKHLRIGFSFPAVTTSQGYQVAAEKSYAAIGLFTHPAPLILIATLATLPLLVSAGVLDRPRINKAWRQTVKQCVSTSIGVLTMVMMALTMMDAGMTSEMARGVASVAGLSFPLVSPFIGALGCFMTGSNTSSNVLFGAFQTRTASLMGINPLIAATEQTVGASLASAIAPAKVLLGSSTVGLQGRESEVLQRTIWYCMLAVLVVGVQSLIASLLWR
jgi:lactate permease